MKNTIKQKADQIAECIYNKVNSQQKKSSLGLYNSEFGILLFLYYYSKYTQNPKYILLTETYTEELLDVLSEKLESHTFCSGLAGILYLFKYLKENDFVDIDINDAQIAFDDYLITKMRQDIARKHYDFMHGALGVGLYFLKKGTNDDAINELIEYLYNTAEKDPLNKIIKWKSLIDIKTNKYGYNIALSHGISSIIIFLCRALNKDAQNEKLLEMLNGAVNYILSQQINPHIHGSCFPSQSIENGFPLFKSRLAWCYGDLGAGLALWHAGKTVDNKEWEKKGMEVLLYSAKRLTRSETAVMDAGICHGSAGIAMIYRRLYIETGNPVFSKATDYWIEQTLKFSEGEDVLSDYMPYRSDEVKEYSYNLLEGISGIGLVILDRLNDDNQKWDEMFLIS